MEKFDKKKYHAEWQKENTITVTVRLFKSTDSEIIKAISESKFPMATEAKRLIRLGIKFSRYFPYYK